MWCDESKTTSNFPNIYSFVFYSVWIPWPEYYIWVQDVIEIEEKREKKQQILIKLCMTCIEIDVDVDVNTDIGFVGDLVCAMKPILIFLLCNIVIR